jgi:drug/metabolite transporter (DMT)-like permease
VRTRGYFYLVVTTGFFGLGAVLANMVTTRIDPLLTTQLNLSIGTVLLGAYLVSRHQPLFPRELPGVDWVRVAFASVVGTGISLAFVITGLSLTSPVNGGFLMQLQGPTAIVVSTLALGERFRWWQGAGITVTLFGGFMVVMRTVDISLSAIGVGDILVFVGAVLAGVAFVPVKTVMARIEPLQLTFLRLLIAAITLVPIVVFSAGELRWQPTEYILLLQIVLAVTNFCLAFVTLHLGLSRIKAWEAASILQLEPAFTVLASFLLLALVPTPLQFAGGALMIAGGITSNVTQWQPIVRRTQRACESDMGQVIIEESS